jgi:hypothetical protein
VTNPSGTSVAILKNLFSVLSALFAKVFLTKLATFHERGAATKMAFLAIGIFT